MATPFTPTLNRQHISVLVVGYGNLLRSDDGLGQWIANQVAKWDLPGVKAIAIHQLAPEVGEALAQTRIAIFVDASKTNQQTVQLQPLLAAPGGMISGHWCDPPSLLAMAEALYGYHPQAWWLTVPGQQFEVGESFSVIATQGIEVALPMIKALIETVRPKPCTKSESCKMF